MEAGMGMELLPIQLQKELSEEKYMLVGGTGIPVKTPI